MSIKSKAMAIVLTVVVGVMAGTADAQTITGGTMDYLITLDSGFPGTALSTVSVIGLPIVPFGTPGGGLGMPPTMINDPASAGYATGNGAFRVIHGLSPFGNEVIRPQLHNLSSLLQSNPAGTGVAARIIFDFTGTINLSGAGGNIRLPLLLEFDGTLGGLAGSYVQFDGSATLDTAPYGGPGPVISTIGGTGLIIGAAGPATGAGRVDSTVVAPGLFGPWIVGNFGPFAATPVGGLPAGPPPLLAVPPGPVNADFYGYLALEVLNDEGPTGINTYPIDALVPLPSTCAMLIAGSVAMIARRPRRRKS